MVDSVSNKPISIHMKGVIPQRAIFEMEGFIVMIKDLNPPCPLYKYVDDSTACVIIPKNSNSSQFQQTIDITNQWTKDNDMKINPTKTK